jgi:hypothetical protein
MVTDQTLRLVVIAGVLLCAYFVSRGSFGFAFAVTIIGLVVSFRRPAYAIPAAAVVAAASAIVPGATTIVLVLSVPVALLVLFAVKAPGAASAHVEPGIGGAGPLGL